MEGFLSEKRLFEDSLTDCLSEDSPADGLSEDSPAGDDLAEALPGIRAGLADSSFFQLRVLAGSYQHPPRNHATLEDSFRCENLFPGPPGR